MILVTGSQLAKVENSASYEDNGLCKIKTITTSCKNISSKYKKERMGTDVTCVLACLLGGLSVSPIIEDVYKGQTCDEFNSPVESY